MKLNFKNSKIYKKKLNELTRQTPFNSSQIPPNASIPQHTRKKISNKP